MSDRVRRAEAIVGGSCFRGLVRDIQPQEQQKPMHKLLGSIHRTSQTVSRKRSIGAGRSSGRLDISWTDCFQMTTEETASQGSSIQLITLSAETVVRTGHALCRHS